MEDIAEEPSDKSSSEGVETLADDLAHPSGGPTEYPFPRFDPGPFPACEVADGAVTTPELSSSGLTTSSWSPVTSSHPRSPPSPDPFAARPDGYALGFYPSPALSKTPFSFDQGISAKWVDEARATPPKRVLRRRGPIPRQPTSIAGESRAFVGRTLTYGSSDAESALTSDGYSCDHEDEDEDEGRVGTRSVETRDKVRYEAWQEEHQSKQRLLPSLPIVPRQMIERRSKRQRTESSEDEPVQGRCWTPTFSLPAFGQDDRSSNITAGRTPSTRTKTNRVDSARRWRERESSADSWASSSDQWEGWSWQKSQRARELAESKLAVHLHALTTEK